MNKFHQFLTELSALRSLYFQANFVIFLQLLKEQSDGGLQCSHSTKYFKTELHKKQNLDYKSVEKSA